MKIIITGTTGYVGEGVLLASAPPSFWRIMHHERDGERNVLCVRKRLP